MEWTYEELMEANWYELRDIVDNYDGAGCGIDLWEVVDDDYIYNQIIELARNYEYESIASLVSGMDNSRWGDNYYALDGYGNYTPLDEDDLYTARDEVLRSLREYGTYLDGDPETPDEDVEEDVVDEDGVVVDCDDRSAIPFAPSVMATTMYGNVATAPVVCEVSAGDFQTGLFETMF